MFLIFFTPALNAQGFGSENSYDDDYNEEYEGSTTDTEVKTVTDFDALFKLSKAQGKVIMLEMSASYCGFCRKLEAEIIKPMIISGDYDHVIIRQLEIDSHFDIKMPDGKATTPAKYAYSKSVSLTPTILFLNHKNEEVAERILGINSVDYFSGYVDDAIDLGNKKIKDSSKLQ